MERNIPKAYESNTSEPSIYKLWESSGYTKPENVEKCLKDKDLDVKSSFTITLPPPNANGNLHLGHMCGYSFHDAFARFNRMTGHPTLLVPGKDHAGIQTESAFTKVLQNNGEDKWEMGRDEFYKRCYEFCMANADNARSQEKNIGLSADYEREFFTLDPKLTKIVYETFYKMYEEGMVYRDKRIVNVCPNCKTALADIDTDHEEQRGIFAYIKYPLVEKQDVKNVKAIILDLHKVLGKAFPERDEKIKKLLNITQEELEEKFFKNLKKHFKQSAEIFDEVIFWKETKETFGMSENQLEEFRNIWEGEFEITKGAIDFLSEMKSKGFKLGILSNGYSDWGEGWLPQVIEMFDVKVFSGNIPCEGKPSKDIYKYVENALSLHGDEILFVDDEQDFVAAAKSFGWRSVKFGNDFKEVEDFLNTGQEYVTVATTRPETMLGDTAVAVNPRDERYKDFIGKKVLLPIANREIPIIGEEEVDIETGTGALKVTPAHSPVDFKIGKIHGLDIVNVIDEDGKMTGNIPERFKGMGTVECSKALCKELDEVGLLVKIENIKHEVAVCERCGTPIEPVISNQWYVNVEPLAKKALEALKNGEVKVIPEGQQRALEFFYENIEPWCISRQLWWGQRIPVWYSGSKKLHDWLEENDGKTVQDFEKEFNTTIDGTGDIYVGEEKPEGNWEAESDVFDTWFSSGQIPYSVLGGPDGEDYSKYYPTQMMIHARDILFWWTARMIMFGLYRTNHVPYSTVLLTGMILASDGSKMSKSKGNGIEPKEVFEKYGADALRLWYYSDALPGSNAPLREEKIKGNRNFVNKIWNASRFILMNIEDEEIQGIKNLQPMYSERMKLTNEHITNVKKYLERYQLNLGAEAIREFFWHELCDGWIEEIKTEIKDQPIGSDIRIAKLSELLWLLKENLKIMHPFVPFVTEAVWQELVRLGLAEGVLMVEQV